MNVCLENVNLESNSGPNYFAQKLIKYMGFRGTIFDPNQPQDIKLTFIESHGLKPSLPMVQRLDGIYFNGAFDCDRMNYNIRKTYEASKGVVFQTNFNKDLIFNWFGEHDNYRIINNGSDVLKIENIKIGFEQYREKYDNIWSCAAHWHSFKRLKSNIEYFLNFAGENDCLIVAGNDPDEIVEHPRIFYVGDLNSSNLLSLFKSSKYFIHLAYLDHCPNVVIDARACGCQIICSSAGGTKEIAGKDAIVIQEKEWDFSFLQDPNPPNLDYGKKMLNPFESPISMAKTAKNYEKFLKELM
ncbi:MAG TPA: hypothetical protein DCX27_12000 [Balneola sp.]|nr:hypothetical protein [Balneola sp.]